MSNSRLSSIGLKFKFKERERIDSITWNDENGQVAMFNSQLLDLLLTKSTLVWHEKDSAKYLLCNGATFGKFKWCFENVWKLQSLKKTTIQQKEILLSPKTVINDWIWRWIKWHFMHQLWMKSTKMETWMFRLYIGAIFSHGKV